MSNDEFNTFAAQGYNHIPVVREVLADLDTPLSAYMKLASGSRSYLLESVQGGEKWGRYSIIGLTANTVLRVSDDIITIEVGSKTISEKQTTDPFAEIDNFLKQYRVPDIKGLPRFSGGLVGYFGYDCVRYIEPRLGAGSKQDPLACPDIMLMVSDRIVVFDNVRGKLMIIVHADPSQDDAYAKAQYDLDMLVNKLTTTVIDNSKIESPRTVNEDDFVSGFTQEDYQQAVAKIKDYIVEGDVMQVVLSQRLSIPYHAPPLNLYRALRSMNPSPNMFYINFDEFQVVGASPEILVRLEDDTVTVRPIAGTRPRGKNDVEDKQLEDELLADPKELAEHLMLIDLGRNDISRVSKTGSVKVTEKMIIERYSHVMHIVSNVIGKLDDAYNAIDVLRATFPAGTVSGAPKIRAMEIIDELEPVKRGVYAGAVGYLSWKGNMDTAIAIRTAVIKNNILHIQAGAGIVADSVPEREWEETMSKGRAIFRAVSIAENGLI
ncbi:MAG: anthranilate synthase component I [Proteobacteria bacterium]|nr:anthranilate synthase component I [Pseudomonadota bacterium]